MSHPVVMIAGPGRSGTTFLWRLLKALGYDTDEYPEYFRNRREEANNGNIPYVVKGTAGMCHNLDKYVERWDLEPVHVIVAMRRLQACIDSRIIMKEKRSPNADLEALRDHLKDNLPLAMGRLWFHLINGEYDYTVVAFPESVRDVDYCYEKITQAMGEIPYEKFVEAWEATVDEELIHEA
ncbi:MAG: hypothetical protein NWE76_06000 [Candidatus Bathyarchaeota archaeon]|nr:hypothetical protein [Candidatus Bathyarchaeota archaeon]